MAEQARVAAVTMVRDEAFWLPRWIAHYSRECGSPERLLVIDDNSSDGSTDDLPCPVVRIPPLRDGSSFEGTRMRLVSALAAGLLEVHEAVLFADADEFLVADPAKHETLADFVTANPDPPVFGAVGLNVLHHPTEPGLRPDQPLLAQRGLATFLSLMCKPALKRVPAAWGWASHGIRSPFAVHPDLFLFHAKFADRDLLRSSAEHRRALVEMDGRAARTNWSEGADPALAVLDRMSDVDPAKVLEFRVTADLVADVVRHKGRLHRAIGLGQMKATATNPVVRIPERFADRV